MCQEEEAASQWKEAGARRAGLAQEEAGSPAGQEKVGWGGAVEASSRRQKQARAPIAVRQEEAWGVAAHRAEAGRRCWCQEEAGEAAPGG